MPPYDQSLTLFLTQVIVGVYKFRMHYPNMATQVFGIEIPPEFLFRSRHHFLKEMRESLGAEDLDTAITSSVIPHYHEIKLGFEAEPYLVGVGDYPGSLGTCIAQTHLNYSNIYN